ncbi:hypothetical protein PV326_002939 [Microctonus aethiopoides]|nr:hypothetical protein PV326_002939 [Microctonus aethiopoides]
MNKLILCSYSVLFIISSLTFTTSIDKQFKNKLRTIDHGFVNPKILSMTDSRPRRWINSRNEVHVSISNWLLKTHPNDKLLMSPNFMTEWVMSNDSIIVTPMSHEICRIHLGHVNDNKNSRVIMTICDGNFYVFFHYDNRSFTVNPITNGSHILKETKLQSLRSERVNFLRKIKRDLQGMKNKIIYNLTGDTFDFDNDNGPIDVQKKSETDKYKSQNYFSDHTWTDSKFSKKFKTEPNDMKSLQSSKWLELGIAVDYSVIEFHGERVQQYVLALLNIVSAIYRDPSLEANLTLVIVRMVFYVGKRDGIVHQGNARKSLENVNKWNRNVLLSTNKAHDVAVWLTRLDIGGPSGYAPVAGVCDPSRSCALNRDEDSLGLTHDGDETADNFCGREALMGSVMAPMVAATFHRFHWSSCSREEYHRRVKQWTCLNNYPGIKNVTVLKEMFHDSFTMDEQCRMEFGDGYELCRSLNTPGLCSHLWCSYKSTPQVCKTKKGPPLEGTICGKDKWCVNGYCEPTDQTMFQLGSIMNNPRDSGWSEWSSWSKCSTTCGVGVQLRSRLCKNSTENNCQGNNHDIIICEQMKCRSLVDSRREKCNQLSNMIANRSLRKNRIIWLPHIIDNKNDICRLTCKNKDNGHIWVSNDFIVDGTPCSYNSSNICIQGKCYLMGCDNVLNSGKRFDACGICDGDNSTCISISNKFQRKIRRANTRVAFVPAASYNINIHVEILSWSNDSIKFILRDGRRRKYEIRDFDFHDDSFIIIVEGTEFRVAKKLNQYQFFGRGPTLDEIVISLYMVGNEKKNPSISVHFNYITNREKDNQAMNSSYSWLLGGWSPCSVTCGSGTKRQTIACRNDQTGRIENKKKCLYIRKPAQQLKQCNTFSCEFKWIAADWEECTKTCGAHGIQQRQIYCVHSSFSDNQVTNENKDTVYRAMLPPNICQSSHPPETKRECNRFPCRGDWIFTNWSTCSQSCGQGVQSRMARCVSTNGERMFDCDGEIAPDELRSCKRYGHNLAYNECDEKCRYDKSRYCIIPNLKQYCQIAEFQKYCCRACLKKKNHS